MITDMAYHTDLDVLSTVTVYALTLVVWEYSTHGGSQGRAH